MDEQIVNYSSRDERQSDISCCYDISLRKSYSVREKLEDSLKSGEDFDSEAERAATHATRKAALLLYLTVALCAAVYWWLKQGST